MLSKGNRPKSSHHMAVLQFAQIDVHVMRKYVILCYTNMYT